MDSIVDKAALGLLSDQTSDIKGAMEVLDNLWLAPKTKRDFVRFARVIQELAGYEQGRVMKKLMSNWLSRYDDSCEFGLQQEFLCGLTSTVLPKLTTSKVAAQVCLTGEGTVENLVFEFARKFTRILYDQATPLEASLTFQAFSNFSQASKLFRKSMQALGLNPLPPIHKVLAGEYLKQASEIDIFALRESLARMIEALSLSGDSRLWLIDAGYIYIIAELYRTRMQGDRFDVLSRCNIALLRLISSEDSLERLRQSGFLSTLEPLSTVLKEGIRGTDFWELVKGKLTNSKDGQKFRDFTLPVTHPAWKNFKRSVFSTPVVCSWKECEAMEYTESMLEHLEHASALSRCGRCGVARYCSQKHQKLHWPSHKRHCVSKGEKPLVPISLAE
ncbi:hypothetical protein KFL_001440320 [Klebsormidium nitens]|uniref:MYND-type domain-containing protein n=1 Tax=Klebsormidium nitens TaxID=105231 RepID=A0A1Y1HXH9_KLENI|nr:hypothetical protein KFL_001440320 [Klebsormidium nitens]|eukprot:GAQ83345.1 hypothetical protein KFL_001440320 [Klebsormidium nitens]